jgi:hypothetical protein
MADFIAFNEGRNEVGSNGLPATCYFFLSTKGVDAGTAHTAGETLAAADLGEITGTGSVGQGDLRLEPPGRRRSARHERREHHRERHPNTERRGLTNNQPDASGPCPCPVWADASVDTDVTPIHMRLGNGGCCRVAG